jgi:hypothetical protein
MSALGVLVSVLSDFIIITGTAHKPQKITPPSAKGPNEIYHNLTGLTGLMSIIRLLEFFYDASSVVYDQSLISCQGTMRGVM